MNEQRMTKGVEITVRTKVEPIEKGREYRTPEIHDLGKLEQVRSNINGYYYDGPRTTYLRY